jgi:hypothetical protein
VTVVRVCRVSAMSVGAVMGSGLKARAAFATPELALMNAATCSSKVIARVENLVAHCACCRLCLCWL